jgi:hypothetical protein
MGARKIAGAAAADLLSDIEETRQDWSSIMRFQRSAVLGVEEKKV